MIHLSVEFPAGRYHATPWNSHVNEGQIEWPPSPWRILRSLIATGYSKLGWFSDDIPQTGQLLIEKLAGTAPTYTLPKVTSAHSRHYMPLAKWKNGKEQTTLVFDTWLHVKDPLLIHWDITLNSEESELLHQIVERISYLGRSESWVNIRLVSIDKDKAIKNCLPDHQHQSPENQGERVPLFVPLNKNDYQDWRNSIKKSQNNEENKTNAVPPPLNIIECLKMQTNDLKSTGWSQPPGSQIVFYIRPDNSIQTAPVTSDRLKRSASSISAMLLSVTTASGNNHALPHLSRTLPQADLLHRALVFTDSRLHGKPSIVLRGKDDNHKPLQYPHLHAHILPLDLDSDDHIDHFLIYAPMGLNADAQAVIRTLRKTYMKGGISSLELAIAGTGNLWEISSLPGIYGQNLKKIIGNLTGNHHWRSITPFVPPRFMKKKGHNTLEGQIRKELINRELPEPAQVHFLLPHEEEARKQRHFIRKRRFGTPPPQDVGFTVELTFTKPVYGPLTLGYGSHFGLGLFAAID